MYKKLDLIAAILLVFLGSGHLIMTPVLAPQFQMNPADFAAIGLAFLYLGLLNIIRNISAGKRPGVICIIANLLGIAWLCFSTIQTGKIELQGILPFVALCYLTGYAAFEIKRHRNPSEYDNRNQSIKSE
jgi:hypothetical protein